MDPMQLIIVFTVVNLMVSLLFYVWYALALSKVFTRLGSEGWKAWVPILNEVEILTRGGVPGWSVVYYFIPILQLYGLYLKAIALSRINAQFGYGGGMTALGILLAPVWASILGFGKPRTDAITDERIASVMPSVGTGPLAANEMPTFAVTAEPVQMAMEPVSTPPDYHIPEPQAATSEPAAPAQIHNPWAPTSPSDAPTPTVSIPPAIVPPVAATPQFVLPVASPPSATPPAAPAAAVESVLTPPPVASSFAPVPVEPASVFPVLPTEPEPVAEPVAEPELPALVSAVVESFAPAHPAPREPSESAVLAEDVAPTPAPAATPAPVPLEEPASPALAPVENEEDDEDEDDEFAATVVVDRRPVVLWSLLLDDARVFPLTSERIELGRKPEGSDAGTQYLPISDTTRTLSKTHARLELVDGQWSVVDLNSTNGVVTVGAGDVETLVTPGGTVPIVDRFILGKVGMRVVFEEGAAS